MEQTPDEMRPKSNERIGGDRREDRRYEIQLEVKWKLIRRRKVLDQGVGRTLDLSSGGILIDAGRHLPVGLNIELSIAWPALLHNIAPMQLVVEGRIVRAERTLIAIRTVQHEFRTAGIPAEQRNMLASVTRTPTFLTGNAALTHLTDIH